MACASCVERHPVSNLQQLHVGDHIEFGKISAIKTFLHRLNVCSFIVQHLRLGYLNFHQAIVTEIDHKNRKIKFVEFTSREATLSTFLRSLRKAIIKEGEMSFDDNLRDIDMVSVIHKKRGSYPPSSQEIVKNARRLLQEAESGRSLLISNCEYLANLCVTQQRVSLENLNVQYSTQEIVRRILTIRPLWFKRLVATMSRKLTTIIMKLETILKSLKNKKLFAAYENIKRFIGKWMASALNTAVMFLAVDIYQFYSASKHNRLCDFCFQRWLTRIILRLLSTLLSTKSVLLGVIVCCFTGMLSYNVLSDKKYTRLSTLRTIEPGNVITFNLHIPFSFHDAIVVSLARQFSAGNMKPLRRPFRSLSEEEAFDLYQTLIEELLRNESLPSVEYLEVSVQNNSGNAAKEFRRSNLYEKMNAFLEAPPVLRLKRNGRGQWCKVLLEEESDRNADKPRIQFAVDDEHIQLYHNLNRIYQLEVIHYDYERGFRFPNSILWSDRVVKSEVISMDIDNKFTVYRKTFAKDSEAYKNVPEVIIQKALAKIGERKWTPVKEWSSECVVVNRESFYSRGERIAHIAHFCCLDLLYGEVMTGSAFSICFIDYVFGILKSQIKRRKKNK